MWWKNFEGLKSRFTRSFFYSRETDSPLIAEKSCSNTLNALYHTKSYNAS
jgi:hypothetical protein